MVKRIFRNIVLVSVLAVLLTALLVVPALYEAYEESMSRELAQETEIITRSLSLTHEDTEYLEKLTTGSRVTLIAPDGTVLYDSAADALQMENHAQRPEVMQALQTGHGESTRTSDTLSEVILYSAQRTDDGCVLRLGSTRRSMLGTFLNVLPLLIAMLLGVVLASLLLARRAAKRIVEPLNALDLDAPLNNETYDELAPLLTRMHHQNEQIHQQMRAMESARAELTAILANMREGMILLDRNENVLSINESAARIFDTPQAQAVGQPLLSVDRDADLHEAAQRALHGEGGSVGMQCGEKRYEIYVSPVLKEGTVRGAVLLILDVTERYTAEESRREFTANVSHELKTPLTSISGFAEIIRDGIAQPQDITHFAGRICRESARLIALVNDILELSRLDERKGMESGETVRLMPMLTELVQDFSPSAEKKKLQISLSGDAASVRGDSVLLREMFFNLIDNAVKYTPDGGAVALSVQKNADSVAVAVSDTGIGIPKEHHAHVFERFYRVDKSHSRQTGGTGLGLAIVKHVAQIHHAQVELTSEVDKGTTVRVVFEEPKES